MKLYHYILAAAFIMLYNPLFSQADSVYVTPTQTVVGDQVRVDFPVQSFDQIVCLQYTMNYDPNILVFENIGNINLPDLSEFSFGNPEAGKITFAWYDLTTLGVTRADGESIYSVFFSMTGNPGYSELFIDGSFTIVEACVSTNTIPLIFNNITIAAFITSNEDVENQVEVNVFPNPATDQVTFDVANLSGDLRLEVYSSVGQLVVSRSISSGTTNLSKANNLDSGIYHYKILEDDKSVTTGKLTLL